MNHTNSMPSQSLFDIYSEAKYLSIKHDSYFQVYEDLFSQYVGKAITFIEIGILNGGSLHMWREYFGPQARIIGVDLNPAAKKWEKDGFEIYIGSQSDPAFWQSLFASVGNVDVVLDDGGHTNYQQIITSDRCLPHINDGGMLVIEDVHTSYFHEFGNPSPFSFINFAKRVVDSINARFPRVNAVKNHYGKCVYSVNFFESIVCFHVDRNKCFTSAPVSNHGITEDAKDFRHKGTWKEFFFRVQRVLNKVPFLRVVTNPICAFIINVLFKNESSKLKKLFD